MDQGMPPADKTTVDPNTGTIMSTTGDGEYSGSVTVLNGSGVTGVAAQASQNISLLGFTTKIGDADSRNYKKTQIIYKNDNEESAKAIRDKIGCGQIMQDDGQKSFDTDILVIIGADF